MPVVSMAMHVHLILKKVQSIPERKEKAICAMKCSASDGRTPACARGETSRARSRNAALHCRDTRRCERTKYAAATRTLLWCMMYMRASRAQWGMRSLHSDFDLQSLRASDSCAVQKNGWSLKLLAEFSRDPPVYFDHDESIDIRVEILLTADPGTRQKPPYSVGHQFSLRNSHNGVPGSVIKAQPLAKFLDDEKTLITVQIQQLGIQQLRGIRGQYAEGTFVFGRIEWTVELDLPLYGHPATRISCLISGEAPDKAWWDRVWANAPQSGVLGHCLSEAQHRRECWHYMRQRLFSVPVSVTRTELVLAAKSSEMFFGQYNSPTFRAHFPVRDELQARRFRTCAVVGNAGHLFKSGLGEHIDAHEMIIRFNEAPTAGFERDVGSRTTHRIFPGIDSHPDLNPSRKHLHDFIDSHLFGRQGSRLDGSEHLVFVPNAHDTLSGIGTFMYWSNRSHGGVAPAGHRFEHLLSSSFIFHAWSAISARASDKTPTSGFLGLMLALCVCDEVDTYGMGPYRRQGPDACLSFTNESGDIDACLSGRGQALGAEDAIAAGAAVAPLSEPIPPSEGRGGYSYFERQNPRAWSYNHKWDEEEFVHQALHQDGILRRFYDAPV